MSGQRGTAPGIGAQAPPGLRRALRLAGFALLAGLALVCATTRLAAPLETAILDSQHRLLERFFAKKPAREVVVVGIDENTLRQFPEPLALWHPYLGRFLEAMGTARPAAVGLDVIFPDRSFDFLVPGYDKQLLQGMLAARQGTKLVIGLTEDEGGAPRPIYPPFVSVAGRNALGYVLLPLDPDNLARRASERIKGGRQVPTLVGQMMRHMGAEPAAGLIDYSLGPQPAYIPLQQVLDWQARGDTARLRAAFADKPVLMGSVLRFGDRYFQPVNLAGWERDNGNYVPGLLIHAQILKSMLNRSLIAPAPQMAVAALALLMALLWFVPLRLAAAVSWSAAVLGGLYAAGTLLLYHGIYLGLAAAMLTALAAAAARWLADSLLQLRERRRLRRAFSGYVSPPVMEEILGGRLAGGLGGDMREICVMFADVRGFTTFSETLPPAEVIALLNRYFERVMQAIHAEGGTVNCIMGDGIMAIFGAPKAMEQPCVAAVAAARRMLAALPELNRELEQEGKPPLSIGIGLNFGEAIVGHVGSMGRHDYSAIGDTTNLASRLEGLTKGLGYRLVCSKAVVEALGDPADFVSLGVQAIKGRSPVEVYGWRGSAVANAPQDGLVAGNPAAALQ